MKKFFTLALAGFALAGAVQAAPKKKALPKDTLVFTTVVANPVSLLMLISANHSLYLTPMWIVLTAMYALTVMLASHKVVLSMTLSTPWNTMVSLPKALCPTPTSPMAIASSTSVNSGPVSKLS